MNKRILTIASVLIAAGILQFFNVPVADITKTLFPQSSVSIESADKPKNETIADILAESANDNSISQADQSNKPESTKRTIILTRERTSHILYGDHTGGGHRYGAGRPCKSEFPASWSDADIVRTVKKMAANDNLAWRQGRNGYYVSEQMQDDGINVRVVLGPQKRRVITAYPVNVERNPCPANDR